jgi:peptidoglycan/xylan/chitin deacetylase (PgdA/CDA1 family)
MDRRTFLTGALGVAGVAAVASLCGCTMEAPAGVTALGTESAAPSLPEAHLAPFPTATPNQGVLPFDGKLTKAPFPSSALTALPGKGNHVAWTVDDGFNADVVRAYAEFARDTGARITFFICANYPGWRAAQPLLQPLINSGQVQIANHTISHRDLTTLSTAGVQKELLDNHAVIKDIFNVDARPYFRPPYGKYNATVLAAAAAVGYTRPVMWYGSLADSSLLQPAQVVQQADKWFLPQHVVIGHANYTPVTSVFPKLVDILNQRKLVTVTLNDVFTA